MTFKKNAFLVSICKVAIAFFSIFLILSVILACALGISHPVSVVFLGIGGMSLFEIILVMGFLLENNRTLIVSEDGIELRSKVNKTKYISWDECGFIGVFGYYFGACGNLVFSKKKYICYSQNECSRYADKHRKEVILAGYTPELFAALEQYAPAHLVSGCKALMS